MTTEIEKRSELTLWLAILLRVPEVLCSETVCLIIVCLFSFVTAGKFSEVVHQVTSLQLSFIKFTINYSAVFLKSEYTI
jgi:hypothetical protein